MPPSPVVPPLELPLDGGGAASPKLPLVEPPLLLLPLELPPLLLLLLLLLPLLLPPLPLALFPNPLPPLEAPHAGIKAAAKTKVEPTRADTKNE
jgi:hypothetical protein